MELIFVIVIIGILSAVALPRLFTGVSDAKLAKAKTQIATIRSGISSMYSKNILAGQSDKCPELEDTYGGGEVFEKVVHPPIKEQQQDVSWRWVSGTASDNQISYELKIEDENTTFTYEKNASKACPFTCNSSDDLCKKLTQ